MIKALPIVQTEKQRLKKRKRVTTFPQAAGDKCQRPLAMSAPCVLTFIPASPDSTRHGSVSTKASPRASPGVAVNLHGLSWGILFALVEAGTPFQGHTSVFMPDLRESNPQGVIQSPAGKTASARGQAREPEPWLLLGGHRHPSTRHPLAQLKTL